MHEENAWPSAYEAPTVEPLGTVWETIQGTFSGTTDAANQGDLSP